MNVEDVEVTAVVQDLAEIFFSVCRLQQDAPLVPVLYDRRSATNGDLEKQTKPTKQVLSVAMAPHLSRSKQNTRKDDPLGGPIAFVLHRGLVCEPFIK